ncbi:NepR family anti-sigma factor [Sphingorhabdus sp.]|uniref:NepR family anti-sigma factor n=1 Tax=Sphingorhabdus sp. TaxID=1902408 RepID=UPI00359341AE
MTNTQTSPTLNEPMLAEQKAMVMEKTDKPGNHDEDSAGDPIAAALRQMHDAVASEELPDDFLKLLDEIDMKIASKKASH